jgi:hypothetical protein
MPDDELVAARLHFDCTDTRMRVRPGDLVVGRYALLPFYAEQERDFREAGATCINTLQQHSYVADLQNYVEDLGDMTPRTWSRLEDVPRNEGPFVLKGETNSKKSDWARSMFARDWEAALTVHSNLTNDSLIGAQRIYVRKYVPLVRLGEAIGGVPLTKEFRFFVCDGVVLSGGFYWDAFADDILYQGGVIPDVADVPQAFLAEAVSRVAHNVRFFAIDVAQAETGEWIVIELNDGQQSGLSANQPDVLYRRLAQHLRACD